MKSKVVYVKPTTEIVWMRTGNCLMAGSMTQSLKSGSVEDMESGSFGSRRMNDFWEDDEE